jgi:hypothetical protein
MSFQSRRPTPSPQQKSISTVGRLGYVSSCRPVTYLLITILTNGLLSVTDANSNEILDDLVDISAMETDFRELGGFYLDKGSVYQFS